MAQQNDRSTQTPKTAGLQKDMTDKNLNSSSGKNFSSSPPSSTKQGGVQKDSQWSEDNTDRDEGSGLSTQPGAQPGFQRDDQRGPSKDTTARQAPASTPRK